MVNIVFSTSDRVDLFEDTICSLIKYNPEIDELVENVYILDDRSSLGNRNIMELLLQKYFPNKGRLVTFNDSSHPFAYVKKFDFIKNTCGKANYTLFIEEDWRSIDSMELSTHVDYLTHNPNIDQIVFSEHFWFQDNPVKDLTSINEIYWEPNKSDIFKHTYGFSVNESNEMFYKWIYSRPMFTFNPALTRNSIFLNHNFTLMRGWEDDFHNKVNATQLHTKLAKFVHTGEYRSVEGTRWG